MQRAMSIKTTTLPKHVPRRRPALAGRFLPDYDFLIENWEKHFPNEPQFRALRLPRDAACAPRSSAAT